MSKFRVRAKGVIETVLVVGLVVIAGIAVYSLFGDVVPGSSVTEIEVAE